MKIKNFNLFVNESETPTETSDGFDWFDQKYLKTNGWIQKDRVGARFERKKPGGGFYRMVFKEDQKLGPGYELSEVLGKEVKPIKTMFKKEDCWDEFQKWQKSTFGESKKPDGDLDGIIYRGIKKLLK